MLLYFVIFKKFIKLGTFHICLCLKKKNYYFYYLTFSFDFHVQFKDVICKTLKRIAPN